MKKETIGVAMLALKSYKQMQGFSVLDADELFFINGGSESLAHYGDTRQMIPSSDGIDPIPKTTEQQNEQNQRERNKTERQRRRYN